MAKIPLIIDCDPGHDDAIALMLAASASDVFDLRAVTTVGGAQSVDKTFYNARRVLTVIGLDVPVARGAAQPWCARPWAVLRSSTANRVWTAQAA